MVNSVVAFGATPFDACTVKVIAPVVVGVPEITAPVRVNPAGSVPLEMLHVIGAVPVAARVALYAVPTVPFGKVVVVMAGDSGGTQNAQAHGLLPLKVLPLIVPPVWLILPFPETALFNVSAPVPLLLIVPLLVSVPERVCAAVWFKVSVVLLAIDILPPYEAGAPPPSVPVTVKAPPFIVVWPVYVLLPESDTVPAPLFVTVPVPEITPLYSMLSERLNVKYALFVIFPATLPAVPPFPI